jgi:hypothetical protein
MAEEMGKLLEPYQPSLGDFCDILRDYSHSGLKYFKKLPGAIQQGIRQSLGNKLEENSQLFDLKFSKIKQGKSSSLNFLPMPQPGGDDFAASFFLPYITGTSCYTCSFTVLFWINFGKGATCAIRFEPSGGQDNAHGYTHMQLSRDVQGMSTSFELWTPSSYPAVPLGYHHPIQLFVGIATAVHGYAPGPKASNNYVRRAILDAIGDASAAKKILCEVDRMLKVPAVS